MEKKCVDLDKCFQKYLKDWIQKNGEKYGSDMDKIEEMVPDIYEAYLQQPSRDFEGLTPIAYFAQFEDAGVLIDWLCEYDRQNVPVPDLLLDRIVELGKASEPLLVQIVGNSGARTELRMTAGSMLQEMESTAPEKMYIKGIVQAKDPQDILEMYAESLTNMGETVVEDMISALAQAEEAGKDLFADILSNYPGHAEVLELLLNRFDKHPENRALYASYLAKYGDEAALSQLYAAAADQRINYLDYIEVVNAIEALGGEKPADREFAGDPYYESLKNL